MKQDAIENIIETLRSQLSLIPLFPLGIISFVSPQALSLT